MLEISGRSDSHHLRPSRSVDFRALVQKLTCTTEDPSVEKLPVTMPAHQAAGKNTEVGPRRPVFKQQERRQNMKNKLEITLSCGDVGSPFRIFKSGEPTLLV